MHMYADIIIICEVGHGIRAKIPSTQYKFPFTIHNYAFTLSFIDYVKLIRNIDVYACILIIYVLIHS